MSEHPPTDPVYEGELEARLLDVLRSGPTFFEIIVMQAEGAYPTEVLAVLRKLERKGAVTEGRKELWRAYDSASETTNRQLGADASSVCQVDSDFPEAHPLDFDWRFGRRALDLLTQRIGELDCPTVAVLGAPTLFKFLIDHGKTAHLFDRNEQITRYLTEIGTGRFELPTPRTPSECSTRLSHVPTRKEPVALHLQRMGLTQGFYHLSRNSA